MCTDLLDSWKDVSCVTNGSDFDFDYVTRAELDDMRNFYDSRSLETRTKSELTLTITDIFVFVSESVWHSCIHCDIYGAFFAIQS